MRLTWCVSTLLSIAACAEPPLPTMADGGATSVHRGGTQKPRTPTSQLAVSESHACRIAPTGELRCWGDNALGQLGNARLAEVRRFGGSGKAVLDVTAGMGMTCACDLRGDVRCAGFRGRGRAAVAAGYSVEVPPCSDVSAGYEYACSVSVDGDVHCWGTARAVSPPLATGSPVDNEGERRWQEEPVRVAGLRDIVDIDTGLQHACAIDRQGSAFCWGNNRLGQLSNGPRHGDVVAVPLDEPATAVAAGDSHSCALTRTGRVVCWGRHPTEPCLHDCLDGADDHVFEPCSQPSPTNAGHFPEATGLVAGDDHTCVIDADGQLVCWGHPFGEPRQFRPRSTGPRTYASDVIDVDIEGTRGCIMHRTGEVRCWGSFGQIEEHAVVPPGDVIVALSAGGPG